MTQQLRPGTNISLALTGTERTVYDVLGKFVPDAYAFRDMMRQYDCVVSGSAALYLFTGLNGKEPGDLDVYTTFPNFYAVVNCLMREQGAMLEHATGQYQYRGICQMVSLRTATGRIDVMRSPVDCALYPTASFWSTAVINFFGAQSWGIAYPTLTLHGRGLYYRHHLGQREEAALQKYAERGFSLAESPREWADLELWREPGCLRALFLCNGQVSE